MTNVSVYLRRDTSDAAAFEHVFGGAYALDLPREPRLIIDLGANVGYASVYFAMRYPHARVIAVEPEPSNIAMLRRNARLFPQIDVVHAAAWPRPEMLALDDVGKGFWGMRVRVASDGDIRGITVADLLEEVGGGWIDLLKVDIEGSELELFSEHTDWVESVRMLVVELHDRFRPGCRDAVVAALDRSGRRFSERRAGEDVIFVQQDVYGQTAPRARSSTRQTL